MRPHVIGDLLIFLPTTNPQTMAVAMTFILRGMLWAKVDSISLFEYEYIHTYFFLHRHMQMLPPMNTREHVASAIDPYSSALPLDDSASQGSYLINKIMVDTQNQHNFWNQSCPSNTVLIVLCSSWRVQLQRHFTLRFRHFRLQCHTRRPRAATRLITHAASTYHVIHPWWSCCEYV